MAVYYKLGQYMAKVIEQGFSESNNGNPQIVIKIQPYVYFDYTGGVETEVEIPGDSYPRTIFLTVTENTTEFVLKKLRAAGFQGNSFRELDLVGKCARCRCSSKVDQKGEEREDWDLVYQSEAKPLEPLGAPEARKLDALFGKMLKGTPAPIDTSGMKPGHAAAVHAQQPPEQDAAMAVEDDVPF